MARKSSNGAIDPLAYQSIVGASFATHDHRPLIVIGNRQWDRWQLGRLGCPHPSAAVRVQRVLKTLRITTVEGFVNAVPQFAAYRDIGVTSYWVVLALLHDLGRNVNDAHGDNPTFNTMHHRALKKDSKRRKRDESKGPEL